MRPTLDDMYLDMLPGMSRRATCARRAVAAVVTSISGRIIGVGFNGVPRGFEHCTDIPCPGAKDITGDNRNCLAVHAEQNAILNGWRIEHAHSIYVSVTPCFSCAKMIANTNICRVLSIDYYADVQGLDILSKAGIYVYARNTGLRTILEDEHTWLATRPDARHYSRAR